MEEVWIFVGILTILFGLTQAASSIAMTSEHWPSFLQITSPYRTLVSLYSGGTWLSGILSGQAIEMLLFIESWIWLVQAMSSYDYLLLLSETMVLLMTFTLGMIPSMIKKTPAGWIPKSS